MNDEQKERVLSLRKQGLSHAAVAAGLSLSVNTVKSFCRRHEAKKPLCRNCGMPLEQTPKQKPKSFCCAWCRDTWWKTHRNLIRKKHVCYICCARCGKRFESYAGRHRKYCSHDCYIKARFPPP